MHIREYTISKIQIGAKVAVYDTRWSHEPSGIGEVIKVTPKQFIVLFNNMQLKFNLNTGLGLGIGNYKVIADLTTTLESVIDGRDEYTRMTIDIEKGINQISQFRNRFNDPWAKATCQASKEKLEQVKSSIQYLIDLMKEALQ